MFNACRSLKTLDISSWNVSSLTSMYYMFAACNNLESVDLSQWEFGKPCSFSFTFSNCAKLKEIVIGKSSVQGNYVLNYTFRGCGELTMIDLSAIRFPVSWGGEFLYLNKIEVIYVNSDYSGNMSINAEGCAVNTFTKK